MIGSEHRLARRGLAVFLLVLPVVLIWQILAAPLLERYLNAGTAIEQSAQLLARYRANASHKAQLMAASATRRQELAQVRGFIDGANQPLASSTLQTALRRIVEAQGGAVRVLTMLPPTKDAGYDRLTARLEVAVTADRLGDLLHGVEASASPSMAIDVLEVRAPDQGGAGQKAEGNTSLVVRLDVVGYWAAK